MSIPIVLGVAVLAGIIVQRLCELVRARVRSRRWICYLHYSIGEHTTPTNPAAASRSLDSSRPTAGGYATRWGTHMIDGQATTDSPHSCHGSFDPR